MNKLLFTLCIFAVFSIGKLSGQTVYITENGKKYHAKKCSLAKTGKKGITLAEAIRLGYDPCKVCKADEIKAITPKSKPKPKKTN